MAIRVGAVNLKKRFICASEVLLVYVGSSLIYKAITKYVSDYSTRVLADGGSVEGLTNVTTLAQNLRNSDLFERLTLGLFPSGFKAGKLYAVIPENGNGALTVVRNTTATRVNNAGFIENVAVNVPRLNYDSIGGNPFLLVEPQRTNLQIYSNDFTNAVYIKNSLAILQGTGSQAVITQNYSISPANIQNASRLQLSLNGGTTSSDRSGILSDFSVNIGSTYSFSIWLKSNASNINILIQSTGGGQELLLATVTNTWKRFELRLNNATGTSTQFRIHLTGNTSSNSADLSIYESQTEMGALASSNILTTSAAVTRNADVLTVVPPVGTVKITTTFSNDTTQVITSIPATYTAPEGLIKSIVMDNVL